MSRTLHKTWKADTKRTSILKSSRSWKKNLLLLFAWKRYKLHPKRGGGIFHSLVKQPAQPISSVILWATYSSVSFRPSLHMDRVINIAETDRTCFTWQPDVTTVPIWRLLWLLPLKWKEFASGLPCLPEAAMFVFSLFFIFSRTHFKSRPFIVNITMVSMHEIIPPKLSCAYPRTTVPVDVL